MFERMCRFRSGIDRRDYECWRGVGRGLSAAPGRCGFRRGSHLRTVTDGLVCCLAKGSNCISYQREETGLSRAARSDQEDTGKLLCDCFVVQVQMDEQRRQQGDQKGDYDGGYGRREGPGQPVIMRLLLSHDGRL